MKIIRILALFTIIITGLHMGANIPCATLLSHADDSSVYTYQVDDYILYLDDAGVLAVSVRERIGETFRTVYPIMAARYNKTAPKTVYLNVDTENEGVAHAAGNRITLMASWINSNPNDTDCITHELFHVVQSYRSYDPVWLIEGITDYARYKFGLYNDEAHWSLPGFSSADKYTDSYRVTARFLVWIEQKKNPDIVANLDIALRNGTYTANKWVDFTGKTLDELWSEYAKSPAITGASAIVTDIYYTLPYKTEYNVWESLDLEGLNVVKLMQDGTVRCAVGFKATGYSGTAGPNRITVTYQDMFKRFYVNVADPPVRGDVNRDGCTNLQDIMKMRKFILSKATPSDEQIYFADMNGDGTVSAADVMRLRNKILGV